MRLGKNFAIHVPNLSRQLLSSYKAAVLLSSQQHLRASTAPRGTYTGLLSIQTHTSCLSATFYCRAGTAEHQGTIDT